MQVIWISNSSGTARCVARSNCPASISTMLIARSIRTHWNCRKSLRNDPSNASQACGISPPKRASGRLVRANLFLEKVVEAVPQAAAEPELQYHQFARIQIRRGRHGKNAMAALDSLRVAAIDGLKQHYRSPESPQLATTAETTILGRRTAAAAGQNLFGRPFLRLSRGTCTRRRRHGRRHPAVTEIDKRSEHEGKHDCAHELDRQSIARQIAYVPQAQILEFPYAVIDLVVMGRTAISGRLTGHDG